MAFPASRTALISTVLLSLFLLVAGLYCARADEPDPLTVGKWKLSVPGGLWFLDIRSDGSYAFHSEANDNAPSHSGKFFANGGVWTLQSTTGITDGGTYTFQGNDTFVATGHLGTGNWQRIAGDTAANGNGDAIAVNWQAFVNESTYLKLSDAERLAYVEGALDGYMTGYQAGEQKWGTDYVQNCGAALNPTALRAATDEAAKGFSNVSLGDTSIGDVVDADWAMYNGVLKLCKH
jgi:hypothetical protein